ncbi:hypothetical protein [Psychrobacillus antarcticus]|uniref:hypothetical protein n=1 Tax=Psychrobacillus antarcticus TaxID=2879115 RepID=UPI0024083043|nr:hypothetical protein [Psychrobacillus antarcticus]
MKLNDKFFLKVTLDGIITGLALTLFFKAIQLGTGYKVYTLLLNVDYLPILKGFKFPEIVEVLFHLIVSIALAVILVLIIQQLQIISNIKIIAICMLTCFIIGALYFPTTLLSDRTPPITSIPSLVYWIIGHLLYGFILGVLLSNKHSSR